MKVEIEFAFDVAGMLLISGWLISSDEILKDDVTFNGVNLGDTFIYERPDVAKIMRTPLEKCTGFLACLSVSPQTNSIEIKCAEDKIEVELSSLNYVTHLFNIDSVPKIYKEKLATFLEKNGFYLGQKAQLSAEEVKGNTSIEYDSSKIQIDYTYKLDNHTLLVIGWVLDPSSQFKRINLRINNTISDNILQSAFFHSRYDVCEVLNIPMQFGSNIGFVFTVSLPEDINPIFELIYSQDGVSFTGIPLKAESFSRDESWLTEILLANVDATAHMVDDKFSKHVATAVEKCWKNRIQARNNAELKVFGEAVQNPKLSLIIPIYGRYDFVQIQMSQFSLDNSFRHIEIVYVLDDPRISHPFMVTCYGVFETFGVPFKVVFSERNLGYAGANNLGVNYATSNHILLMNSDVIPKIPGSFDTLLNQFVQGEDVGILGATLLYEDDTIQHQGMEYMQDPSHPGMWMNYHPQKGFPLSLTEQFEVKEAQAVTGALMLMTKQQYLDVGGFDIGYILGDFEDSDLCMKVRNTGKRIAVSGTVHMYHLERLSQSLVSGSTWKHTLSMVNGLRHTNKWNSEVLNVVAGNG